MKMLIAASRLLADGVHEGLLSKQAFTFTFKDEMTKLSKLLEQPVTIAKKQAVYKPSYIKLQEGQSFDYSLPADCNHAFDQAFRELYTAHYTGKANYAVSKPQIPRVAYGHSAWMSLPNAQLPTALPGQVTVMVINPRT